MQCWSESLETFPRHTPDQSCKTSDRMPCRAPTFARPPQGHCRPPPPEAMRSKLCLSPSPSPPHCPVQSAGGRASERCRTAGLGVRSHSARGSVSRVRSFPPRNDDPASLGHRPTAVGHPNNARRSGTNSLRPLATCRRPSVVVHRSTPHPLAPHSYQTRLKFLSAAGQSPSLS